MSKGISRIKNIVENTDTTLGRIFDLSIQTLIVLSLVSFSITTIPELSSTVRNALYYFEVFTVVIFSMEYILRIIVTNDRWGYISSFYGIIDLLAILPFYLSTAIDLRSIRVLRLFRLFRILKIARYSKAMRRYAKAFKEIKEELIIFLIATIFMIYIAAVGIFYFENQAQPENFKSVFSSLWWSVATLTTVGYGDVYPITVGGRIFTFIVLLIGLSTVTVPAGLLASALEDTAKEVKKNT